MANLARSLWNQRRRNHSAPDQSQTARLMILIRDLRPGGAQRQLTLLAREMHRRGVPVIVVVFYAGGALEKELHAAGVAIHALEKRGRWDIVTFLWRLICLVHQQRPQALYSYLEGANILSILLKPLFPQIHMVWSVRSSDLDLSAYDWLRRWLYPVECVLSRFANLIIANSQAGRAYAIEHGFPEHSLVVIPNGIDTERFCPDCDSGKQIRVAWDVGEHEPLIGIVARLDPVKDHPTFLRAAAAMALQRADVRFVCVGSGSAAYQEELNQLGARLGLTGRLIWVGARDDMPAIYNALDIVTSTSTSEGFPNVIGEAMACGVPCVVTDAGDSAAIVGDTGVVVPVGSVDDLVKGWCTLLDTRADCWHSHARAHIVEHFSTDALVERTWNLLVRQAR